MDVFGTRGVTFTSNRGRFHCPQCGGEQDYARRRVHRFFTLLRLPLLPLGRMGEYVECSLCAGTFEPEVLAWDPATPPGAFEPFYKRNVRELMVRMLLADGRVEESELDVIERIYPRLIGETIDRTQIEEEIDRVREAGGEPLGSVRASAPFLNDMGRETLIRAALFVAAADGDLDDTEMQFLSEIAGSLGVSRAHLNGILQES